MKVSSIVIATLFALSSGVAVASSCPKEMKAIDAALPSAKLSAAQMTEVKKLRADGETFHKDGKHKDSLDALNKAKKIMGI